MLALLLACVPGLPAEDAIALVQTQAAADNPTGRIGQELIGKSEWVEADMFDRECVERKNLAFADTVKDRPAGRGGIQRVSATYEGQRWITDATESGFCVLMGEGVSVEVGQPALTEGAWVVPVSYTVAKASPWVECLSTETMNRSVVVKPSDAGPVIEGDLALFTGDCPVPMPPGEERGKDTRPNGKPKKAPTRAQVDALVSEFDQALFDHDWAKVLDLTSCYNLVDSDQYGSCVPADVLLVGPHPRGEERMGDGMPWSQYSLKELTDYTRISGDSKVRTMFHVTLTHKRTKRDRSFSVEWVDGGWKMVGVIHAEGHDLTTVRYLNDLHKKDVRDVFVKRLDGEKIDEAGNWLPGHEPDEE
jgi:hypothetical protein